MQASSLLLIVAAFAGAMISMGFVLLMSKVLSHMATLIVSGVYDWLYLYGYHGFCSDFCG